MANDTPRKKAPPLSEVDGDAPPTPPKSRPKNPRRVAAGKRNWKKRKGFTAAGIERLRQAALRNRPWDRSTGPRTAAGKAISSKNRWRTKNVAKLFRDLRAMRGKLLGPTMAMRKSLKKFMAEADNDRRAP